MKSSSAANSAVSRLTARGAATRRRIVEAAASLVHQHGSLRTSLDDVMAASATSKSQLYHYFANKEALLHAVIEWQTINVMRAQSPHVDSLPALRRWADALVHMKERQSGLGGCPLGSLASELADRSEAARALLMASFQGWESHLLAGFSAMRDRGELSSEAQPLDLATATLSALQGGILLAQTYRDARPVRVALDMALAHIERYVTPQRPLRRGNGAAPRVAAAKV